MGLTDYITPYLDEMTFANHHTHKNKAQALQHFIRSAIPFSDDCLKHFDMWLQKTGYAATTRYGYVSALRSLLHWLAGNDMLPPDLNIIKAEMKLKSKRGRKQNEFKYHPRQPHPNLGIIRTHYDAQRLSHYHVYALETLRNRAILHTLFSTACRCGELCSMNLDQVRGKTTDIIIRGKGNSERIVYLDAPTRAAVSAYINQRRDDCPALFVCHGRNVDKRVHTSTVYTIVTKAGLACGIRENSSPHMIRHLVAIQMINNGVPLEIIQDYLGHASPETTKIVYAHIKPPTIRGHIFRFFKGTQPTSQLSIELP